MTSLTRVAAIDRFEYPVDFRDRTWGVQSQWASKLTLLWKNIGADTYRIKYIPSNDTFEEAGWWFAVVHLLGIGMGWTDIGLGLRRWREEGWRTDHPILKTLWITFRPSLEALEIWFESGRGEHINELLRNQARQVFGEPVRFKPRDQLSREETQLRRNAFNSRNTGPRSATAAHHFFNDGDSLHLTGHFPEVFTTRSSQRFDLRITDRRMPLYSVVQLETAEELPNFLTANHEALFEGIQMGDTGRVQFTIRSNSLLLPLEYSLQSGRWFWNEPFFGSAKLRIAHLYGVQDLAD